MIVKLFIIEPFHNSYLFIFFQASAWVKFNTSDTNGDSKYKMISTGKYFTFTQKDQFFLVTRNYAILNFKVGYESDKKLKAVIEKRVCFT